MDSMEAVVGFMEGEDSADKKIVLSRLLSGSGKMGQKRFEGRQKR